MKNLPAQLLLGLWASFAAGFGIMSRSWGTFFAFSLVFLFNAAWLGAGLARKSHHRGLAGAGRIVNIACSLVVLACFALAAEQALLVNGNSYPDWLATGDLGKIDATGIDLFKLADNNCKARDNTTIREKSDGLLVIRCGGLTWIGSETYLAHKETPQ